MKKFAHSLFLLFTFFGFSESHANSMINNNVQGTITGRVVQEVSGSSSSLIEVGSATGKNLRNIRIRAIVNGDIVVKASDNTHTKLSVGSYRDK